MIYVILILIVFIIFILSFYFAGGRAVIDFNLVYLRALRIEKNKEIALTQAIQHLRDFYKIKPFNQLSEENIFVIGKIFSDLPEPNKAVQPLIKNAFKSKDISKLQDEQHLVEWKRFFVENNKYDY